jgi:putative transcriptional regulator
MLTHPRIAVCKGNLTIHQANTTEGDKVNNRLRVLRAERAWSQAELGGRLGVSRQAVNAIETGKHDPSLPLAFRIARLFDMPIEAIFLDDEGTGQ